MAEPLPLDRRYRPAPEVRTTRVDGDAVLLDLETERYFSLNRTGSTAWEALEAGGTGEEAVRAVMRRFDVPEDRARADVQALLSRLSGAGLLTVEG